MLFKVLFFVQCQPLFFKFHPTAKIVSDIAVLGRLSAPDDLSNLLISDRALEIESSDHVVSATASLVVFTFVLLSCL